MRPHFRFQISVEVILISRAFFPASGRAEISFLSELSRCYKIRE